MKKLLLSYHNLVFYSGLALLVITAYRLAIQPTILLWHHYREVSSQLNSNEGVADQPAYLLRKNKNLDKVIAFYQTDSTTFRTRVVSKLAILAERDGARLSSVPNDNPSDHQPGFIIQRMSFEGDFFSLIRLLDDLQRENGVGVVRSLVWKRKDDGLQPQPKNNIMMDVYLGITG